MTRYFKRLYYRRKFPSLVALINFLISLSWLLFITFSFYLIPLKEYFSIMSNNKSFSSEKHFLENRTRRDCIAKSLLVLKKTGSHGVRDLGEKKYYDFLLLLRMSHDLLIQHGDLRQSAVHIETIVLLFLSFNHGRKETAKVMCKEFL